MPNTPVPVGPLLAANELVAWNLRRIRELRGWTQAQAAEQVARCLGRAMSATSYSNAERSCAEGRRRKVFDVEELYAFARAFGVPPWLLFAIPGQIDETAAVGIVEETGPEPLSSNEWAAFMFPKRLDSVTMELLSRAAGRDPVRFFERLAETFKAAATDVRNAKSATPRMTRAKPRRPVRRQILPR